MGGRGSGLLLTVDVGNTHTVLAVFTQRRLLHAWRLSSAREATADELAMTLRGLLDQRGFGLPDLDGLALASVVPPLGESWRQMAAAYLSCRLVSIGSGVETGLRLEVDHPEEVGADRIADGVAAWHLYGAPVVVVDCGTATKIEAIASGGRYVGGVIAPGIAISAEALFQSAALLHRVPLEAPARVLGKNTAAQVQAGIVFGFAGQIDALVDRVRAEMGGAGRVVATGGLSGLVAPASRTITDVDPALTLHGLRLIYERQTAGRQPEGQIQGRTPGHPPGDGQAVDQASPVP